MGGRKSLVSKTAACFTTGNTVGPPRGSSKSGQLGQQQHDHCDHGHNDRVVIEPLLPIFPTLLFFYIGGLWGEVTKDLYSSTVLKCNFVALLYWRSIILFSAFTPLHLINSSVYQSLL